VKTLSVKQPWASLIISGVPFLESEPVPGKLGSSTVSWKGKVILKDIENRNWPTTFRGRICIHATKRNDDFDSTFRFLCERIGLAPMIALMSFSQRLPHGAIIGEIDITDCVTQSNSPWFTGPYGFVLENPVMYDKPLPCHGRLGFWEPSVEKQVKRTNTRRLSEG